MKDIPLTSEQIAGLEKHDREFQERCDRVASIHNSVSVARQKAIDFVKKNTAKDKAKNDFLNKVHMKNENKWNKYVEENTDEHGLACVEVAKLVMRMLDKNNKPLEEGYFPNKNTAHGMMCIASDEIGAGLSGNMSGYVVEMILECHARGEEFRISYNGKNKSEGIIDPSIITITKKS